MGARNESASEVDAAVPFGSVFLPHVHDARSRLDSTPSCVEASFIDDLARALLRRMSSIGASALLEIFEAEYRPNGKQELEESHYRRYVNWLSARDHAQLRNALPVLGDLLDEFARQWVANTNQTLRRIEDDRSVLGEVLGSDVVIARSSGPLGDPHNGGNSVLIVTASDGGRIVYKPRSLAQEHRAFEVIHWCNHQEADTAFVPRTIDRGSHGWMEFVESSPCVEASAYWRRAGRTTAVLYLAGAVDLHNGNVIATSGSAIPIDLECVEQPVLWASDDRQEFELDDTVVSTGLLPNHYTGDGSVAQDVGGLLGHRQQSGGAWLDEWNNLGTTAIERVRRLSEWGADDNRPVDPSGDLVPVHLAPFQQGFAEGVRHAGRPDSPLQAWHELPARVLLRSTMSYVDQLASLTETATLESRSVFAQLAAGLPPFPEAVRASLGPAAIEAINASESAALARLDVPLHRAHGRDLLLDGGNRLSRILYRSGEERRRERIAWMAGPRLGSQHELIRLAVEQHEGPERVPDRRPIVSGEHRGETELVAAARIVAEGLVSENIGTPEQPSWLEVDQAGHRQMRGLLGAADFYSGRMGIGVFFAALAAVTDEVAWADWARRCVAKPVELNAPWWESGTAGSAYATLAVGEMLADREMLREAESIMAGVLQERPDDDAAMDLVGGWSGVLNTAMAVLDRRPDSSIRQAATQFADAWVMAVRHQLADPISARGLRRAGFAHGVSGLGYTMQRAAVTFDRLSISELANELIEFDIQRTSERGGIAGRVDRVGRERIPASSWCWGASGYLLARTSSVMIDRHDDIDSHVAASLPAMCGSARGPSHLCCGEAGRLVMLDTVARELDEPQAHVGADALAAALVDDIVDSVPLRFYSSTGFDAPSLFWGRAGVGYALCRVASPAAVPNVLLVE